MDKHDFALAVRENAALLKQAAHTAGVPAGDDTLAFLGGMLVSGGTVTRIDAQQAMELFGTFQDRRSETDAHLYIEDVAASYESLPQPWGLRKP